MTRASRTMAPAEQPEAVFAGMIAAVIEVSAIPH